MLQPPALFRATTKWVENYAGVLRRMRFVYWLFNLIQLARLLKNRQLYREYGIRQAIWKHLAHADIQHTSPNIPWMDKSGVTAEEIRTHPQFATFPISVQEQLVQWPENGFIILPGLMIEEADQINSEIDILQQRGKISFNFTGKKIFNAWQHSTTTNRAFHHPLVLAIAAFIFEKAVLPFQTVNFIRGSGEKPHSDSIHMTTEPLGYLSAMWVALEDIQPGSGELLYYPGSHKLKYVMSEDFANGNTALQLGVDFRKQYEDKIADVIQQHNFTPHSFLAKKGDVLIWHANLLHAGSPVQQAHLTRKSLVAHYFAEGVLQYHEITQRPAILPK